jgi:triacylglycerol lipase
MPANVLLPGSRIPAGIAWMLAASLGLSGCGSGSIGAPAAGDPGGGTEVDALPDTSPADTDRDLAAIDDRALPDDGRADDDRDAPSVDSGTDVPPADSGPSTDPSGDVVADDADADPDAPPEPLSIESVQPDRGGASVATGVIIRGRGFVPGMTATLGGVPVDSLAVLSRTQATATFGPVALTERGPKDLEVLRDGHGASLKDAFTFEFDQDPIVFVHGFMGGGEKDFGVMVGRFRDLGYPEDYLNAITYQDDTGENVPQARDELAPYVDAVLARTGASKVDIVAHSMGGLSSRLYVLLYGGKDKVRDYVSTCGAHHGTSGACATLWWAGAREMCPAYAGEGNDVQWTLNGDPDREDVDETPFGVEDGGSIHWHAIRSDGDLIILPYTGACLNQKQRDDCSDPINVLVSGLGHNEVPKDEGVFRRVAGFLMEHTPANP